jgi:hypothetical protein
MEPNSQGAATRRTCCMLRNIENGNALKSMCIRVCGVYCVDKIKPKELTEARKRARLIVKDKWLPVDQWLEVMESAHYVDAMATNQGWKRLKRNRFESIGPELNDDFLITVGRLHQEVTGNGLDALKAIALLAQTSEQVVALWLHVAEQRGLIQAESKYSEPTSYDG